MKSFDGCVILQPTSISSNGGTQRPMLVIVQNPGMADFDDFVKEPNKVFNISSTFDQPSEKKSRREKKEESMVFMDEVVVDVKTTLKSYSFLQFENRSNSSIV